MDPLQDQFEYMAELYKSLSYDLNQANVSTELNLPDLDETFLSDRPSSNEPNEPVMPAPWISWGETNNDLSAIPEGQNIPYRADHTPNPKTVQTTHEELKELENVQLIGGSRAPWQGQKPHKGGSDIQMTGLDKLDQLADPAISAKEHMQLMREHSWKANIVGSNTPDTIKAFVEDEH